MFVLNVKFNKKIFIKVFTIVVIILVTTLFIFTIKKVIIPASKNKMLKMNVNANAIEESNQKNKHNASRTNNHNNNNDNNNNNSSNNNINEYNKSQCDNDINQDDISNNKSNNKILEINSNNFTTFLKNCNENIDSYVGKTVHISGFVYRLSDFSQNQFVVARLMPIHYESASNKKSNFMVKLELDDNSDLALYGEADLKLNYKSNLVPNLNQKISKQTLVNQNANDNCVVVGILCEGNTLSDFKSNSWVDITGKIEVGNYKGKIPIINVNSVKQTESKPNELFVEQPQ